jgi:hypothetical protein
MKGHGMPHTYTIAVVSKEEGDFEIEDVLLQQIQDFAVELCKNNKDQAHVLVSSQHGVDVNELGLSRNSLNKLSP